MAQSDIPRKSAHIADTQGGANRGPAPLTRGAATCSNREVMNYVAEMAASLAELAASAREHEVAGMLHAAGRKARQAAATN